MAARPTSRARGRTLVLAGALLLPVLLSGCGPSYRDVASLVLASTPLVVLISLGLLRLLLGLWRKAEPSLAFRWKPQWIHLGVTLLVFLPFVPVFVELMQKPDFLGYVLAFYGSSYLAVFLLVWRIWFAINRVGAFRWANVAVTCLFVLPALPMLTSTEEASDPVMYFYIYPGVYGVPTGILLLIVFGEAAVRAVFRRRSPPPPPKGG